MRRLTLVIALHAAFSAAVCAQWTSVAVDEGTKPALALGPDCIAEVSYMLERTNGYVRHARIPRSSSPTVTQVAAGYFYGPLDVAVSRLGTVYVAYHNHSVEDQVVAIRAGGIWTLEQVSDAGHDGWDNSVLVTEDEIVHTSSVDPSGFGGRGVEHGRRSTSGVWNVEPVGSPQIMYANATSVGVDSTGKPVIAYYNDSSRDLEVAERVGVTWTVSVVDSVGDVGRFPSLVVDAHGDLHVAYYEHVGGNTGVVRYARRSAGSWVYAQVDSLRDVMLGFSGARRNVALAVDDDGLLHVAYGDRSLVKYARGTPGNWTFETVVDERGTATELGQQVDLSLCDVDGTSHVVYYVRGVAGSVGTVYYASSGMDVSLEEPRWPRDVGLHAYPNPASGAVTIEFSAPSSAGEIGLKVVDVLGRVVLDRSIAPGNASRLRVPIDALASGLYVVQIHQNSGTESATFVVTGGR